MTPSSPREPKVPQETSHHNLNEVSGPSMSPNSENIEQKHEINICTGREEKPNKAENNNTENPREPSVRPKYWRGNRNSYNGEFRQNNYSSGYSRGSQVPKFDQSRYQEPSSFQTVPPIEEQEEEPIAPNRRNRYRYNNEFRQNNFSRYNSRDSQVPKFDQSRYQEQEEEPIIPNRRNCYRYNNEFRQNNFSREYRRDSQVPKFDQSRYQEPSSFRTVAPREEEEPTIPNRRNRYRYNNEFRPNNFSREYKEAEPPSVQTVTPMEEEEPITPKGKNRNRRSKQTLRLQRLLIQPQSYDECESTEDDSDEDILMSQLNPIPT
ncbi:hypothetical protein WMY93_011305 [Mugilogobius chulae]|uniref:Uncharacterized protein n=1 Tax=Mugilogobius chulae TaxID=88201 RepID=A0AAW0P640_9GOBI